MWSGTRNYVRFDERAEIDLDVASPVIEHDPVPPVLLGLGDPRLDDLFAALPLKRPSSPGGAFFRRGGFVEAHVRGVDARRRGRGRG